MTMTYEAWRISYQDAEQAACAAYEQAQKLTARQVALEAHMARLTELLEEHHRDFMGDGAESWDEEDWDGRVAFALEDTPETSLALRDASMQAKGARLVATRAWERTQWETLGITPQEQAGNLATIVANELSRAAVETREGGAA